MTTFTSEQVVAPFRARGGARLLFQAREREILIEGPAGTGKTRACLELLHLLAMTYPGLRALIVRKHAVTLALTALVTFGEKVLKPQDNVSFFGGSKDEAASYRYPNGSRIVVGGMGDGADAVSKVLSSEYDIIYANEVPELSEDEWENLTVRLRPPGKLEHQRIIGDCNPTYGKHWLYRRVDAEQTRLIVSRLEDNPAYFDDAGELTEVGEMYLATLDALTGTRYQRLRLGLRVGVENAIYDNFERGIHVVTLPSDIVFRDGAFGGDYGRVHEAAACAISVDQYGRRWVRESWAEVDTDHGTKTTTAIGRMRRQYQLRRGRVDPNQDVLIGMLGFEGTRLAEGARQERVNMTKRLFNIFPGGRVPPYKTEVRDRVALGPYPESDSPGLLLVRGAPGIDALADEIEAYHYELVQSATKEALVVARIKENRVAAMEYAIEELEQPPLLRPQVVRRDVPGPRPGQTVIWKDYVKV